MSRALDIYNRILNGGASAIQEMVANETTEELFIDYKRSANDGNGSSLHNSDRSNLSKAVSGFGNSEGGVVIWGVDCRNDRLRGDVPIGVNLIHDPNRFKSWLEQATTGTTVPPHDGVRHEQFTADGQRTGFVVSFIPKGNHIPYQTIPDQRYMMRSGSNFAPVPHGVLAGMFGRQPQPDVFFMFTAEQNFGGTGRSITLTFGITIHNSGPGIASDAFLNIKIVSSGGNNIDISVQPDRNGVWITSSYLGRMFNFILKHDYKLSPEATSIPAIVTINVAPPFTSPLHITMSSGADRSAPYRGEINVSADEMNELYEEILNSEAEEYKNACRNLLDRILAM